MRTILHISDLHFCADVTRPLIRRLSHAADTLFKPLSDLGFEKLELEISIADPLVLDKLRDFALSIDPDVIVVTGDVTTFGDRPSFEMATVWLKGLLVRRTGVTRKCLLVPGNHDLLSHHIAKLLSTGQQILQHQSQIRRVFSRLLFRKQAAMLSPLLDSLLSEQLSEDPLSLFHEFARSEGAFHTASYILPLDEADSSRVVLLPFGTVSCDPLWMNAGSTRQIEWDSLSRSLGEEQIRRPGSLRIVLAHHNPVSSPRQIDSNAKHAYNSMPGGTDFLRELQEKGVDILLHGHQHVPTVYSFDFDLRTAGHSFGIGAASASSQIGAGCNLLKVMDVNNVALTQYRYDSRSGFVQHGSTFDLALERNRPMDAQTTAARFELKRYSYQADSDDEADIWSGLHGPGSELVYMSGRRFRDVRENAFMALSRILEGGRTTADGVLRGARVRILLMDPELIEELATKREDGRHGPDLWGRREKLEDLAREATQAIADLSQFLGRRSDLERSHVDVRVSHTLLPFAAYVRDADKPWGKMAVKVLPIGAIGELSAPVLAINRRRDLALYSFYLSHLKYLFAKGRVVAGNWDAGDEDLKDGMDPDVFAVATAHRAIAGQKSNAT